MRGFDAWLVFRLARQPTWLFGFGCMIAGFAFQVAALGFGPLALVQPILAVELLFVFGYLALRSGGSRTMRWREWAAAVAMSVGISVFLRAAASTGGQDHATAALWWSAGAGSAVAVAIAVVVARGGGPSHSAACVGTSPGALAAEVAGLDLLVLGVRTLSGSALITHTTQPRRAAPGEAIRRELTRRSR